MTASEIDLKVARRLKIARKISGLTQKQLASTLKIASQQIQKYESGENRIGIARLWEISEILGKPIEYFFHGLRHDDEASLEGKVDSKVDGKTAKLQGLLKQIEDDDVKDAIITVIESYLAQSE